MKKIKTVREFQIRLSEMNGQISHSVSTRTEVVEEKDYRKMFLEAIACNCTPEIFNVVEKDILMDDDIFQEYVTFKSSEQSEEEESKWMKNTIARVFQNVKPAIIGKPEIIMTATQATTIPSTETKDTIVNAPQSAPAPQQAAPAAPAPAPTASPAAAAATTTAAPATSEGFNLARAGKTAGLFVLGAAAGAVGKWAWDHFVG